MEGLLRVFTALVGALLLVALVHVFSHREKGKQKPPRVYGHIVL